MGNFNKNSTHNKILFFQLMLQINSSHPLLHCLNKFHFLNIFKLKTVVAVDVVVVVFLFLPVEFFSDGKANNLFP